MSSKGTASQLVSGCCELDPSDDHQWSEPATLFDDYSGRGNGVSEQDMSIAKIMHEGDLKLKSSSMVPKEHRERWNAYYEPRNEVFRKAELTGRDLIRWKYQRYMDDCLSCISSVDDGVGKILDYLKESGLEENTIVVYSSDQGFFLGEHGWFDKRWIFEESLRTPLLVRWPDGRK